MGELLSKIKDLLLGVDVEDEEFEDEYIDEIDDKSSKMDKLERETSDISNFQPRIERGSKISSSYSRGANANVVNLHKKTEINICLPKNIEDARNIIDNTKHKVISVVNLEGVDPAIAQRIADFLSGSVDALDGNIRRLSDDMFIIAPFGVDISGSVNSDIDKGLKSSQVGLSWASGSFR